MLTFPPHVVGSFLGGVECHLEEGSEGEMVVEWAAHYRGFEPAFEIKRVSAVGTVGHEERANAEAAVRGRDSHPV